METTVESLLEEDDFEVFLPDRLDIIEKAGEDIEETRPIGGWCSTEHIDRQDEIVVAKGLDFSDFVNHGWFNDNHRQGTTEVLGFPRIARLKDNRWWTEGNLLKGFPPADKVWELAKVLKKSNTPRRLGFSIEGKVLMRDENSRRILKAKVRNVAITNCPVNTNCTWEILAKAWGGVSQVAQASKSYEAIRGVTELSYDDAMKALRRLRPDYSDTVCDRIVRYAMR